jgi:hypothetical protein
VQNGCSWSCGREEAFDVTAADLLMERADDYQGKVAHYLEQHQESIAWQYMLIEAALREVALALDDAD